VHSLSKTYLKILKPKTRPIQIEPWFFRYLNEGQLKVLSAILAHADYKNRQDNSFASNRTIAFYAGFGSIRLNSKEEKEFLKLSEDKQKELKEKKLKNAIQTVKNIKTQLEKLGVITREIVGDKSYAVVDLEWSKERYLKDFDEYFNGKKDTNKSTNTDIKEELNKLAKLSEDGNISKDSLVKRLEDITDKLTDNKSKNDNTPIPNEDIDLVVEHIINSDKIKSKITTGDIPNPTGYKRKIKRLIEENKYNGIERYIEDLKNIQMYNLKSNVKTFIENNFLVLKKDNEDYYFRKVSFDKKYNIFTLLYSNENDTQTERKTIPINHLNQFLENENQLLSEIINIKNNYEEKNTKYYNEVILKNKTDEHDTS